jgi:hypothetical protein
MHRLTPFIQQEAVDSTVYSQHATTTQAQLKTYKHKNLFDNGNTIQTPKLYMNSANVNTNNNISGL